MKGLHLLESITHIDPSFVADAMADVPVKKQSRKPLAGLVACFVLLAGAVFWYSQRPYVIRLEDVAVNPVAEIHRTQPFYDPAAVQAVSWDNAQIAEYYGKDLAPAYVPEHLEPVETTSQILVESDGTVVQDTVELFYCDPDLPESGWMEAEAFSLMVSTDQLYVTSALDPTAVHQITYISDVEVSLGAIFQENAIQSYIAEFTLGELQYHMEFRQMELVETVKVVASVIQGDSNILVE